jgi:hypothetical protein
MRQSATLDRSLRRGRIDALLRGMFLTPGGPLPLLALSSALIIPAIWAVLSSPVIYSREMTWDLMFNLDGAWRIYTGQTSHVDFHDPLGTLPFAVTALGFYVVGTKPFAFLVGETIAAGFITALAVVAVKDRLALVPGALFVALCAMLALVPVVIGDLPTEFTFAMAYNRFGWSLPLDRDNVIDEFATGHYSPALFGRLRTHPVRHELSQYEYIQTVLELAALLRTNGAAASSVLVIDQVNPLPFVMGARAPRWGNLWWAEEIGWRPPEEAFGETDYVAIPRFPSRNAVAEDALTHYRPYLAAEFAPSLESRYWTVLKRQSGRLTPSD